MATEFAISGISVATATACTNPLDVIKTRLQLQATQGANKKGLLRTGMDIVSNEGVLGLWKGLPPALARGLTYGGLRLGLYDPIKSLLTTDSSTSTPLGTKILSGSLSGGIAAAVTSPTELIKTRLQQKGAVHTSSMAVLRNVVATEGVAGLWRGALPGMARASLLTASQCASYDEIKRAFMAFSGWQDHIGTHFMSSMATGVITTTVTNPVDVVKTNIFVGCGQVGGPLQVSARIIQQEGFMGFFKGWTANYARLGPQTVVTFIVNEGLRSFLGVRSL